MFEIFQYFGSLGGNFQEQICKYLCKKNNWISAALVVEHVLHCNSRNIPATPKHFHKEQLKSRTCFDSRLIGCHSEELLMQQRHLSLPISIYITRLFVIDCFESSNEQSSSENSCLKSDMKGKLSARSLNFLVGAFVETDDCSTDFFQNFFKDEVTHCISLTGCNVYRIKHTLKTFSKLKKVLRSLLLRQ